MTNFWNSISPAVSVSSPYRPNRNIHSKIEDDEDDQECIVVDSDKCIVFDSDDEEECMSWSLPFSRLVVVECQIHNTLQLLGRGSGTRRRGPKCVEFGKWGIPVKIHFPRYVSTRTCSKEEQQALRTLILMTAFYFYYLYCSIDTFFVSVLPDDFFLGRS